MHRQIRLLLVLFVVFSTVTACAGSTTGGSGPDLSLSWAAVTFIGSIVSSVVVGLIAIKSTQAALCTQVNNITKSIDAMTARLDRHDEKQERVDSRLSERLGEVERMQATHRAICDGRHSEDGGRVRT